MFCIVLPWFSFSDVEFGSSALCSVACRCSMCFDVLGCFWTGLSFAFLFERSNCFGCSVDSFYLVFCFLRRIQITFIRFSCFFQSL